MIRSIQMPLAVFALLTLLFALALIGAPVEAIAGGPSIMLSTTPRVIHVVGTQSGVPDAATGRFTVVVRDLAANPVPYATVQVDFSSCPDVVICADQLDPEVTVYGNGSLSKHAGSDGSVTLTILGRGTGAPPQCLASACAIYGGGFLIGRPLVSTYDLRRVGRRGRGRPVRLAFGLREWACTGPDRTTTGAARWAPGTSRNG
jgi:hypothetical protein